MGTQLDLDLIFEKTMSQTDMRKRCLLVPKRHAKKYFDPVVGGDITNDFSPTLSFEDESGQVWQFDYKFWKSDKSYVLNGRGWNRYVSYMSLDTGDVVSFKRQRRDTSRFFIFSRRPSPTASCPEAIAVPILKGYFPGDRNQITFECNRQLLHSHWERLATNDATSGFSFSCQGSTSQQDSENTMLHSSGLQFPATFTGNNNITNDVHQMGMFNNVNTHQALEEFNSSDQGNCDMRLFGQDSTFLNSNINMDAEQLNDEWVNSLLTAYSPSTMPISDGASLGHKIMEEEHIPNNDMVVQADHGLASSFNPADEHYINHFNDYQHNDPGLMAPQLDSFGVNELVNNMIHPHDSMCENFHEDSSIFRS